jgi:hypothetical protein
MSNQYDPGQAPTATFPAIPGSAQPRQEYVRLHEGGTARPAADDHPADSRPPAGNGFTQAERDARAAGKKGNLRNWFTTGDAKLDPNSEQGKQLAAAEYDGWSVASLITAFFVPLAGLILSIVAFAEAKKNHRRVHGTAIGGFIVGALGSLAWTLYWVVVIVAWIALANAVSTYPSGG